MILLYIIICVLVLGLALYFFIEKSTYVTNKDKEFIVFVIDMYIQYAENLEIHSKAQHKKIVKQLEDIKKKHFNEKKKH